MLALDSQPPTIRILVVDDSVVIQNILVQLLEYEAGFEVVGTAQDGREAVRLTALLRPDAITMDIHMPYMDGLEAMRQIMNTTPTPIVVVASELHGNNADLAAKAIAAGALTIVDKPQGVSLADYGAVRGQLVAAIRLIAGVELVALSGNLPRDRNFLEGESHPKIIAVGASTGGPGVLQQVLRALPDDLAIPIVIVQHITAGFGPGFVRWLDSVTAIRVQLAEDQGALTPGVAFIAPEGQHMTVTPAGIVRLDASPPVSGVRPSVTRLFTSVAESYQAAAVGILLTGMGDDGAHGLESMWNMGAYTIAQEEKSCVVYGMPKAAVEKGVVCQVLTPDEIAAFLVRLSALSRE